MKTTLKLNADTDHEDARALYGNYGAHSTVEFDWLDGDDDEAAELLKAEYPELSDDEAEGMIALSRRIREDAEDVESQLEAAVEAYEAAKHDEDETAIAAIIEALETASSIETNHGDDPASKALRAALLDEETLETWSLTNGHDGGSGADVEVEEQEDGTALVTVTRVPQSDPRWWKLSAESFESAISVARDCFNVGGLPDGWEADEQYESDEEDSK